MKKWLKIALLTTSFWLLVLGGISIYFWQPWQPITPVKTTSQQHKTNEVEADLGEIEQLLRYDNSLLLHDRYAPKYGQHAPNAVQKTLTQAVSRLRLDADTASYSNIRAYLKEGIVPDKQAVRVEQMINYFDYQYPAPNNTHPFSLSSEIARAPWNAKNLLLKVGIRTPNEKVENLPPINLVLLIDVSGSMAEANKLPLLKTGLKTLVQQLRPQDHISIISYAKNVKVVLENTVGNQHDKILAAIDALQCGGSTDGGTAIKTAYAQAQKIAKANGIKRILLATDGDFNIGVMYVDDIKNMIAEQRKTGISLSVLGFGLKTQVNHENMELAAQMGNGHYAYIDSVEEIQRVLGEQLASMLYVVAEDVKVQLEFNPKYVGQWRLIGYENRLLEKQDLDNEAADGVDVSVGKSITALYELMPAGKNALDIDSRYQQIINKPSTAHELGFVKIDYKKTNRPQPQQLSLALDSNLQKHFNHKPSHDWQFAAAVAAFGQLLVKSQHVANYQYQDVIDLAQSSLNDGALTKQKEFIDLVKTAQRLEQQQQQ